MQAKIKLINESKKLENGFEDYLVRPIRNKNAFM